MKALLSLLNSCSFCSCLALCIALGVSCFACCWLLVWSCCWVSLSGFASCWLGLPCLACFLGASFPVLLTTSSVCPALFAFGCRLRVLLAISWVCFALFAVGRRCLILLAGSALHGPLVGVTFWFCWLFPGFALLCLLLGVGL